MYFVKDPKGMRPEEKDLRAYDLKNKIGRHVT